MDIQALKAFKAIADLGSFSAAADALFITQPAISKRIATLEQRLGVDLFYRVNRQVKLSQAGNMLLPKASLIIREVENAERTLSHYGEENIGILQLGISHHIGLHRLPPVLRDYSKQYPKVKLDLSFVDSEAGFNGVLNGDLELGLVTLPPINGKPDIKTADTSYDLTIKEIWHDPLEFAVKKGHPLSKKSKVSLEDLTKLDAILPKKSTFTYQILTSKFAKADLNFISSMNTNNFETIRMMVSIGLGWSILPKTLIDDSLAVLPVKEKLSRSLGYVIHPKRPLSNAAKCMIALLESTA